MKFGLEDHIIKKITRILEGLPKVDKAYIFGSRAKGNYRPDSDIDIAVKGYDLTVEDILKLGMAADKLEIGYEVDWVDYDSINTNALKEHIDRVGIDFYKNWRDTELSELLVKFNQGVNTTTEKVSYTDAGIPVIRAKNIDSFKIDFNDITYVSHQTFQALKKSVKPKFGDVLYTNIGSQYGNAAKVERNIDFLIAWNVLRFQLKRERLDPDFLTYLLNNPITKSLIKSLDSSSTMPFVSGTVIKKLTFPIPPLHEQHLITHTLRTLDNKIDLLRRQNKTLESMAEALFGQSFLETAQVNWEHQSLLDIIELTGGGTPKTDRSEYWNGNIKWLSGGDIASNHKGFVSTTEKTITAEGLKNSSAKLLPKFSTVITARGTVGKYSILSEPMAFSQSNYGITPKFDNSFFFSYLLINHAIEELQAAAYGSVFDTITTNTFREYKITLPEKNSISQFENQIKPIFDKILANTLQISSLIQTRDTLLPKLMSGEARVKMS